MRTFRPIIYLVLSCLLLTPAFASQSWQGKAKDAWLDGKLETALTLNSALRYLPIDTQVNDGKAVLSGKVKTSAQRELAETVAEQVDGITSVDNKIKLGSAPTLRDKVSKTTKKLRASWDNLATTAKIKAKIAASDSLSISNIHVSTKAGVVTLTGHVGSDAASQLAELKAKNNDHVVKVINKLTIKN